MRPLVPRLALGPLSRHNPLQIMLPNTKHNTTNPRKTAPSNPMSKCHSAVLFDTCLGHAKLGTVCGLGLTTSRGQPAGMRIPSVLKRQNVAQAALILGTLSLLSKVLGFFREVLVAKYFGARGETDAFLVALTMPTVVLGIFAAGIAKMVIPVYLEKKCQNPDSARAFVSSIVLAAMIMLSITVITIIVFAPFFVRVLAFGFSGEIFDLAVKLTRFLAISGFFCVISGLFTGLFQAEKQFLFPTFVTLLGNCVVVFSLFYLHSYLGIHSWTAGQLLSTFLVFLSMAVALGWRSRVLHFSFRLRVDWIEVKKFTLLLLPLVASQGVSSLQQLVDKAIASGLEEGSVATLSFAIRIWAIPIGLVGAPVATAVFPRLSELATARASRREFEDKLHKTVSLLSYLTIPVACVLFVLSEPAVRLLFQRGAFDTAATLKTASVLKMYTPGIFAVAISQVLAGAFYSFMQTTVPFVITLASIVLNIILNLVLSRIFGVAGIALATSIAMSANMVLLSLHLRPYAVVFTRTVVKDLVKILVASSPVILICYLSLPLLQNIQASSLSGFVSLGVRLAAICVTSLVVYLFVSRSLQLKPYILILSYIKRSLSQLYAAILGKRV